MKCEEVIVSKITERAMRVVKRSDGHLPRYNIKQWTWPESLQVLIFSQCVGQWELH